MVCNNNEMELMSEQEDIYDLERKLQQVLKLQDLEDSVAIMTAYWKEIKSRIKTLKIMRNQLNNRLRENFVNHTTPPETWQPDKNAPTLVSVQQGYEQTQPTQVSTKF